MSGTHLLSLSVLAATLGLPACGGSTAVPCPAGFECVPCPQGEVACQDSSPPYEAGTYEAGSRLPDASILDAPSADRAVPEGSSPPSSSQVTALGYDVVDAKLSAALSSIIIASSTPSNTLHIVTMPGGSDRAVALPTTPVAVAVDAAGTSAAVVYDAHVSWIDLQAGTVKTTCAVSSDAYDVALSSAGVAYVMPATDQWVELHVVDLTTCTETLSTGETWAAGRVAMHPSESALFATEDLDPSRVLRCDTSVSPADCEDSQGQADWGTYAYGNRIWMSADGLRLYSETGVTLTIPAGVAGQPCTYGGALDGVSFVQALADAPQAQRIVLVPESQTDDPFSDAGAADDTVVRIHETQYLGFVAQYALPAFPGAGGNVASHGRFVFTTPNMSAVYVIAQADPSSSTPDAYALETITP